ncbi:Large cysteine-rich periplasmic protein OmcB precursor [Planctomycetes bacterium Pan216]|uniref:Large cysteine-rich periplasmic protein OmcB n=1 Tax=Kolteria novifilia TaxID=2527975 RepID=A0A518AX93_9BACT|nr:Large cysteine-rich periplasmic protein OmcB precursor [Planctomycetes bacterium Pan216]
MSRQPRTHYVRTLRPLACAVLLLSLLPGCLGVSGNPFKLGNPFPDNVVRTHAKPAFRGFYRDFDPKACTITVTPAEAVNQVATQHILIATVCDAEGNSLRNRRVEWHLQGVGHIVEVDESGLMPGRGYLVDDTYAVSYTNYRSHTLTRGTEDPSDDIHLKPGQTWCVITSPQEGESYVTTYAPGIYNWQKHKVFAVKHWVDAQPIFPPSAVNPVGTPHPICTQVVRTSDGSPAQGYKVRYRIQSGPAATLDPGGSQSVEVTTDQDGKATVVLNQVQPVVGANVVGIEVVRPSDKPTGKPFVLARSQMTKTWLSPQLSIQKTAPPVVSVGQTIPYQIVVTNSGSIRSEGLTVRDTIPESLQVVSANPPPTEQGANRLWTFGPLEPQQSVQIQLNCLATAAGTVTNCAEAVMAEGLTGRSCATTQVVVGSLAVTKTAPDTGVVGQPITFQITVTNNGSGPANNVVVTDTFDQGFVHESGAGPVQLRLGNLPAHQSRAVSIVLTPRSQGRLCNNVRVTADGGLQAEGGHCVEVSQPQLSIKKEGPGFAFVGAEVEFRITVQNTGNVPANNVIVRDNLPAQIGLRQASDGGQLQGNTVIWNLGTLAPGQQRSVSFIGVATDIGQNVCNVASVSAVGVPEQQSPSACLNIKGIPALLTELIDRLDPVPVGGETVYAIQITNQGSMPADNLVLSCVIPEKMTYVDSEGVQKGKYDDRTRTVTFPAFNNMLPRKRLIYQIQVRADRPGDERFKAKIEADHLSSPIILEESTTIYDPKTGQIDGAQARERKLVQAPAPPSAKVNDITPLPPAVVNGKDAVAKPNAVPMPPRPQSIELLPEEPLDETPLAEETLVEESLSTESEFDILNVGTEEVEN